MDFIIYDAHNRPRAGIKKRVVQFLHHHLGKYGDPKADIQKCIEFATKETPSFGGFVLLAKEKGEIVGATVINKTGMSGYIPENILVYIATHEDHRGKGIGGKLMGKALEFCKGAVALHVEPDNPARRLYERLGFENKYLEMRLSPPPKGRSTSS